MIKDKLWTIFDSCDYPLLSVINAPGWIEKHALHAEFNMWERKATAPKEHMYI